MFRSLVFSFLILITFNLVAADYSTPMGRVKDTTDRVISILQNKSLDRETSWNQIAALIYEGFDFRSMSQSVLATQWKRASEDERKKFTEFFSQYIEATYRSKIEAYTDQEIIYKDEIIRGSLGVVETVILAGDIEIPVNYKLRNNEGNWFAYDVVVEGVSLVANYRSTFAAIVKNEGMDGLMSDIQRRIEKFKEESESNAMEMEG
ncbi:MAG: MlaC/ttg2D family ABC transporter substrate-binding protein [Gammaproteobacteria bacterium]|jgi:phospholipid transport system substrate-binding protein